MKQIIEVFGNITVGTIILYASAISAIIAALIKAYKVIVEKHDYLQNLLKTFEKLQKEVEEMKAIQAELTDNISKIMRHLEKIESDLTRYSKDLDAYQEEFAKVELNKLRDRLIQSYRYYSSEEKNPMGAWTEIERDAFYGMLHDYYGLKGNGHVKTVVEPSVSSLTVIPISDQKRVSELMQSRR